MPGCFSQHARPKMSLILARGFYSPMERAFVDVRVSHPACHWL